MAQSIFGNVIVFFDKLGVYEVVLPFILTFTIMFAILEKTRVFGTEKGKHGEYSRKNVNSLVSFCIAFFVVASSQLVQIITQVSAQVVVLLLLSVFFLILVGSFHGSGEFSLDKKQGWQKLFMVIMFLGISVIFLSAIKTKSGVSWLEFAFTWLARNISSGFVASIIMLGGLVFFVFWITQSSGQAKKE